MLADDHALVRAGIARALAGMPGYEIVAEAGEGPTVEAALARSEDKRGARRWLDSL